MKITIEIDSLEKIPQLIQFLQSGAPREENIISFIPIDSLHVSARTIKFLKDGGIYSIDKLITCSENDLVRTPNLGRKSINEIKAGLELRGLALKGYKG
jgi:DNA-directed RNA polymerase alpha subunit